ncbi:MAG: DUF4142 domain-containing protein [Cyclobacteriaceae bacterium]
MIKTHYFLGIIALSSSVLFSSCDSSQQTASEEDSVAVVAEEEMNNDLEEETSSASDRVMFAVMSTRMQTELSKVAEQKASSQALKDLSMAVIDTNEMVIAKIQDLAEATNTQIPDALSTEQQTVVDSLMQLQAPEFDQAYLEILANDQQQLIDNLQALTADAENPITRGLIEDIVDMQQPQLERVQSMQSEMM